MSYEVVNSKLVYDGKVMSVYSDMVLMPDDNVVSREFVERGGATAIVPIDNDGNIIFVRQYRHPLKEIILEIPAGMIDEGEEPLMCAYRELEEETGFKSEKITFVTEMYPSVGVSSEVLYVYIAEDLKPGKQNFDPDEFIEVEKYSLDDAVKMIFDGGIKDSKTIVGVLTYKEILSKRV